MDYSAEGGIVGNQDTTNAFSYNNILVLDEKVWNYGCLITKLSSLYNWWKL